MIEKLDLYDKNRNKIGKTIERKEGEETSINEYILAVQCWIINKEGKILLTKRKADKKYGGMWEPTGGLVQVGESSLEGIIRELREEIGITINKNHIKLYKTNIEKGNVNVIRDIYLIKDDILLESIKFNDGEVSDARYVSADDFKNMIKSGFAFEWLEWFYNEYCNSDDFRKIKKNN